MGTLRHQLTTKQHLPKYILLRSLRRGRAAIVGSLDGISEPAVRVVKIEPAVRVVKI